MAIPNFIDVNLNKLGIEIFKFFGHDVPMANN